MDLKAFGRGKVILCGEHAVLRGAPALVLSLDQGLEIRCSGVPEGKWRFPLSPPEYRPALDGLLSQAEALYPGLKAKRQALFIRSELPVGQGLGSSGALCSALARLIFRLLDKKETFRGLWALANSLEAQFHGRPSGIDTGSALEPGLHLYTPVRPGELPRRETLDKCSLPLVWGTVPRRGNTRELIRTLASRADYAPSLDRLAELSQMFIHGYRQSLHPDLKGLGLIMEEMQQIFRALDLSTPELDQCLDRARGSGAAGGKMSGAGGGGAYCYIKGSFS